MSQMTPIELDRIARVVHEAVRAWARANDQNASRSWSQCAKWMREATYESVRFVLEHPDAPASAQHDQWMEKKRRDGWTHGAEKSGVSKTHPMLVPYDELPLVERRKDELVRCLVAALSARLD